MYKYKSSDFFTENECVNVTKNTVEREEKSHTHDFLELVYICSGSGTHFINNISYEVRKGDLLFINYNQIHSFSVKEKITYINLLMKPEFISEELLNSENIFDVFAISLFEELGYNNDSTKPIVNFRGSELMEIESIIENTLSEYENKKIGYQSIINGYTRVLFSKLIRKLRENKEESFQLYVTNITPEIIKYIDDHCFGKISIQEISKKCFYNPSYFSRAFKKYYGKSLTLYIQEKRIKEALELLKTTQDTIDKIAETVGYPDKKQFYKIFKEYVGCTPNEYRTKKPT